MALPDFLIIGAMKCGTSTLQAQLAVQPGIFMCTPKEPNFFSDDEIYARGPGWYEDLFAAAAPGDLKGEASTHYAKLPDHPRVLERLAIASGAAETSPPKIIYLIRNPMERAVSHYIHEWTQGVMRRDVEVEFECHPEMVAYGCFGMQIAPWVEAFGAENVFLSSLEVMNRDPQAFLNRVGAFLGHPQPLVWQEGQARMNASAERIRRLPLQGLLVDNAVARKLRRSLIPKSLRARIQKSRQMVARPELTETLRARMQAAFAEDHARLSALFPGNADISDSYPFLSGLGQNPSNPARNSHGHAPPVDGFERHEG